MHFGKYFRINQWKGVLKRGEITFWELPVTNYRKEKMPYEFLRGKINILLNLGVIIIVNLDKIHVKGHNNNNNKNTKYSWENSLLFMNILWSLFVFMFKTNVFRVYFRIFSVFKSLINFTFNFSTYRNVLRPVPGTAPK